MISKDGKYQYWSTGIVVWWDDHNGGWHAQCEYLDDGWVGDNDTDLSHVSTEGKLHTRYPVKDGAHTSGLSAAVDAVRGDAERLGVRFWDPLDRVPNLYYRGDGVDADYPPPNGWRQLLATEAELIGWSGPSLEHDRAG